MSQNILTYLNRYHVIAAVPLAKYNDLKNSSSGRGFRSYEVNMENDTLMIRMTSTLDSFRSEATQNYGIDI